MELENLSIDDSKQQVDNNIIILNENKSEDNKLNRKRRQPKKLDSDYITNFSNEDDDSKSDNSKAQTYLF
jgi:hypothetical protein